MIVDTSALIAILQEEPEAADLRRALAVGGARISASTLLEASLVARGKSGSNGVRRLASLIRAAQLEVVAFDEQQALAAADAHAVYGRGSGHPARLNLGDCFAYGLAYIAGEPLLYGGDDFSHTDIRSALE